MLRAFFGMLVGIIVVVSVSLAEDQLKVGMIAPTSIVAKIITCDWAERGTSCPVSQEEWDAQLAQLRKLASDKKIKYLSLGVMLRNPDNGKPSKAKRQLGFFGDGDVVVMLIRPDANAKRGVIQYLSVLN